MKLENLNIRLNFECKNWFKKQCNNLFSDYYLYYREAKEGQTGTLGIFQNAPDPTYKLALNNRMNKGYTRDQAFTSLMPTINKLPIID